MNRSRRPRSLLKQDFRNGIRNNIVLYMLGFIIVASIISRLFLPSLESMEIHFAVDSETKVRIGSQLQQYGTVEVYNTKSAVLERVMRMDDVPGIIVSDGRYEILLEGNEMESVSLLPGLILEQIALGVFQVPAIYESLGAKQNVARPITAILLVLSAILISGLTMALLIVDDKESRMNLALSVTPIRRREYIIGRSLLTIVLAFSMSLISIAIMQGIGVDYAKLSVVVLASIGMALIFGFVIGGFAENILGAIALLKSLMFIFLGIPIAAIFIPKTWQWTMYAFPNYWSYRAFYAILVEYSGWSQVLMLSLLTVATTLLLYLTLSSSLKKRLMLR